MRVATEALAKFQLEGSFIRLVKLLATHKRIFLIHDVLKQLCEEYKLRNKITSFVISSSHDLKAEELSEITQFLVRLTNHEIMSDYKIDKSLIAGIRLQSNTGIWEYSIRKQLAQMQQLIAR